jgi:DNA polymerase delta subunit 1
MIIVSIEIIDPVDTVYDIETEVGTFLAGSLKTGILVKNTDSCYVKFPINKTEFPTEQEFMKEQFKVAKKCAKFCSDSFKPPMELEFEKYMYPLALFAKKRYAYKEWTNPEYADSELHYKGLQLVRRDTCKYVKEELGNIFKIIMNAESKENAYKESLDYTKNSIQNLLNGNIDFNKLVLSKQLKSSYKVRKNKETIECNWRNKDIQQPHVRLAQKIAEKDPVNHPKPPDRVPYLFIENKKALLQCDKVIHPSDFSSKNKIDSLYYFDHQYKKPVDMIFELMTNREDAEAVYSTMVMHKINEINGQSEITSFFGPKKVKELVKFEWKPELVEEVEDNED